ncbi:arylsulfatase [Muricauda sp. 2012CJ35-5]|uniref:Arylsulfatase n=1 Tax=Flagellimonas spongiicola TaxID=2942208 RepID=A0ABT0PVJ9_9FLAO|nr:arylsulfatase [Allomuricauda spongiicola]MCL6275006.1 arylsulfatase [Allomuricauda spongiicola]
MTSRIENVLQVAFSILTLCTALNFAQAQEHPNVIVIITDDQGYGDLGITGNPHVQTPVIDQFATESVRFNNFYVSPVCAPTRSSLMTGRYSLRTGVRDTYNGGAIMASNEVTIAEMLKKGGYTTGVFGKWHLGDNYPSRPSDQGFDESLIHLSGGMGQVGDITTYFKGDTSYFDPVLWHNNQQEAYQGYCSDIFADGAIQFIEQNKDAPFFCYLSFNAPHTPLQVPDEYYQKYKDIDPTSGFEGDNRPFPEMSEKDKEDARKVYAMVSNIDDNLGKLFKKLEDLNIADNTLIIFMTDNGPQQRRYVAGMRGRKGNVYQGGVRVPFYVKYPKAFAQNKDIETLSAHIDVLPTLADVCKVDLPINRQLDGKSLLPLIHGKTVDWANRSLFFYWTRRYPELYYNMALQKDGYKLVGKTNYNAALEDFELFNLKTDPYEQNNLVLEDKAKATALKTELDGLYNELITSENLINQPRIVVGSKAENPIFLNRNDAGGERGIWNQEEIYGTWKVRIEEGHYNIRMKFIKPVKAGGRLYLEANTLVKQQTNSQDNVDVLELKNVYLPNMDCDLLTHYAIDGKHIMPFWVEFKRIN